MQLCNPIAQRFFFFPFHNNNIMITFSYNSHSPIPQPHLSRRWGGGKDWKKRREPGEHVKKKFSLVFIRLIHGCGWWCTVTVKVTAQHNNTVSYMKVVTRDFFICPPPRQQQLTVRLVLPYVCIYYYYYFTLPLRLYLCLFIVRKFL